MVTLTSVLEASRASRSQFNDWMGYARRPKILETKFNPTEPGTARALTIENAIEIGFVAALIRAGVAASKAVELSSAWRAELKAKKLAPFFALNPVTLEGLSFSDGTMGFSDLKTALATDIAGGFGDDDYSDDEPAIQINIIDRARIVQQMERLAKENGDA
ncbi:hypothetical protein LQG66_27225 [Bradyrhizobium ontarionense]|uniref:Uncharacterized protein n=1 Tax=Bradyrhizobium ontarionense TaxID=2898149 RepID=A0ABY3R7C3_9BRAD|nr:hypothetical protein [Bradyrhizobium sp. A19]UFZ02922.1 hypothetical protein LQG66_27225 [Bradyrhizobium sp. A19]